VNAKQAAFDKVVKWFPEAKAGPLEPHTAETRARYEELLASLTAIVEQRQTVLEEADAVLADDHDGSSTWRALDLREHLLGQLVDEPSVLVRDDKKALFYGGKRNALFGAYESGKTFVALLVTLEVLTSGGRSSGLTSRTHLVPSSPVCSRSERMRTRSSNSSATFSPPSP
jgi:hypothetical protein